MRFSRRFLASFFKFVTVGALVGIVFSILFIALPLVGLLFLLSILNNGWTLSWAPSAPVIMIIGAIGGGLFAAILFIKDRYIPYVEEVPDFEVDDDDPGADHRLH